MTGTIRKYLLWRVVPSVRLLLLTTCKGQDAADFKGCCLEKRLQASRVLSLRLLRLTTQEFKRIAQDCSLMLGRVFLFEKTFLTAHCCMVSESSQECLGHACQISLMLIKTITITYLRPGTKESQRKATKNDNIIF